MDLQYGQCPENEGELVQFPSSDGNSKSPPPSPNAFSQFEEPDLRFSESDWRPSDLDLGGNAEPIPLDSQASESDLGDEQSVPADPTEFHPLINGM